jgi:cobalt-zinc-cadmium resistance protein CzcA
MRKLIEWTLDNPMIVLLLVLTLAGFGAYAFVSVNVEAYPDPAPPIIEVIALNPGVSAEEMERQVTIPLEVGLSGMPGLTQLRSRSLFGLTQIRCQFDYSADYEKAKQDVINRLRGVPLPPGVKADLSPNSAIGEIVRYTLKAPRDANGKPFYELRDLKALQDWTLQREFLKVPRIAGVVGFGGETKRYEIHPDPERLKKYGITLTQLQNAIAASNANVGGDYLTQGQTVQMVRGRGLLGGGEDPLQAAMAKKTPQEAVYLLRAEEQRRVKELRQIVLTAVNNVPVRVDDVVEGGPIRSATELGKQGVVIGNPTRLGKVGISRPRKDKHGHPIPDGKGSVEWTDEDDVVQAIILLRKGQESLPALKDLEVKMKELNETPGRLLPGVQIVEYYNRSELVAVTTETVRENLAVGMVLVTVILLMFLNNIKTALIVAINIPLALLFAFSVLYLRGKSANLLSIGAVDFGIIVDSSVIMVENIYRSLSAGYQSDQPLKERILRASGEVLRSLLFSTIIMVCGLLPLFTMKGAEGQIFGPMADTYAFALAGALLLALTVSPVLCLVFYKNLRPATDNILVRSLKRVYRWQLDLYLDHRGAALAVWGVLILGTLAVLPVLGREFMPELEEGNSWIRGTFRINASLESVAEKADKIRKILQKYPEADAVVSQIGRPDDGTDAGGFYNVETFVPLKPESEWPTPPGRTRPRTKRELLDEIDRDLSRAFPGVDWDFSQNIRDNVLESISGVKGENSIKIFGPDLDELERLAKEVLGTIKEVNGVDNAAVFRIKGQSNLEFGIDRQRCAEWNVSVADVLNVIETAVGGKAFTQMIEGEKTFDVTLRWPAHLRRDLDKIKDIPVDVVNNTVAPGTGGGLQPTFLSGGTVGAVATIGTSGPLPALTGSQWFAALTNPMVVPRRTLGSLITPLDDRGDPDAHGQYVRPGASMISREQNQRFIAVRFAVRGRDLASTVAECQHRVGPLIPPGYRAEWGGEFQQMEQGEQRLLIVVGISLVLILLLLYVMFRSVLDVAVVFANVLTMSMGGVWALLITGINFNISAAVGFISILGVAVMNSLLLVSSFNQQRALGIPLRQALTVGMERRIRPLAMTTLTAILGLLPAALSTRIGAQSQRPLAIVVVGGMIATLLLTNLVPLLYSFYGAREPVAGAGGMEH